MTIHLATASFTLALVGCFADIGHIDEEETSETTQAVGDDWFTQDDFDNGGLGASAAGIAIDSGAYALLVGERTEAAGNTTWNIRWRVEVGPGDAPWYAHSTYALSKTKSSGATAIAVDNVNHRAFVSGYSVDANNQRHWITRRGMTSEGYQFTTVDDVLVTPGALSIRPASIVFDAAGGIYVLANETLSGGVINSRFRYSPNGVTWSEFAKPSSAAVVSSMCTVFGGIMVVGSVPGVWATWLTVDHVNWAVKDVVSNGTANAATTCTQHSGEWYVAGIGGAGATRKWVVRRSVNNGASWAQVDTVASPTTGAPTSIQTGLFSQIWLAGQVGVIQGFPRWLVRRSANGTTWTTSETYILGSAKSAIATGIGDGGGAMVVVGTSSGHSIVRHPFGILP